MAGAAQDSTGVTVTFGTSSFAAHVLSVDWGGRTRGTIESTHMGTSGTRTYIPQTLRDGGEITLEYFFNCTDATDTLLSAVAETVTIAWSTGVSWAASCFCTEISATAPAPGEAKKQTVKLKVAGAVTEDVTP